ncbi:unnamed protein product, partial [Schistosoma bovis]
MADDVLHAYDGVIIGLHRQGPHSHFKLFFFGRSLNTPYETVFETTVKRQQIELPFENFKSYLRGTPQPVSTFSEVSNISCIGVKAHECTNQSGPGDGDETQ